MGPLRRYISRVLYYKPLSAFRTATRGRYVVGDVLTQ